MALNKFMHPRNIYKTPPNFEKLAKLCSDFSKIAKVDVTGKVTINFKDPHALRVLTKCLLKSDFNLDVEIPEDRLVPTLPLRINYILWIEDLMTAINRDIDVKGIDIGTGACAIYPLLSATKNKWHMLGTESDLTSFQKADENIKRNELENMIELRKSEDSSLIKYLFAQDNTHTYDFCMCNPPFYSSFQELCDSRSPARLPPKNGFTGSPQELITEGGELEFCRKIIRESKDCKNKVLIFTTMVGHKYNLIELLEDLKESNIIHTHTEFCQGRVTRWGLAWTYQNYDIYKLVPPRNKLRKKNSAIIYELPKLPESDYNIEAMYDKIKALLNNLNIEQRIINKRGNTIALNITAKSNTWSNQRRKKRLLKRIEQDSKKIKLESDQIINNNDTKTSSTISVSEAENHDEYIIHNIATDESVENNEPLLQAFIKMYKKESIYLEFDFLDGSGGKESLHQIVQYIKNNWK